MKSQLQNQILSALKARKKTATELATELGQPEETVKLAILEMQTEGLIGSDADFHYVVEGEEAGKILNEAEFVILRMTGGPKPAQDDGGSKPTEDEEGSKPAKDDGDNTDADLSQQEWAVVKLLLPRVGRALDLATIVKSLGDDAAMAAIIRLKKLGIVEPYLKGYRITAQSSLNIPLSKDEKEELAKLETEIDTLVKDIEGKMSLVAENLRTIRDKRLYKATHKRFNDYVADRFGRTRDWGYKMIQAVEVREALQEGNDENVVALLQTLTTRETPHLGKLKKEPAKMQKALLLAEAEAKAAGRPRTTNDVMLAVQAVQNEGKKKDEKGSDSTPAPRKTRTVTVTGVKYNGGDTNDLPGWLREFARWLHKNPTDDAFTVKVSKAKLAA